MNTGERLVKGRLAHMDALKRRYRLSIEAVVREILTSPEFYSVGAYRAKIKSPTELVSSSIRTLGIDTVGRPLRGLTDRMAKDLHAGSYRGVEIWGECLSATGCFSRMEIDTI